MLDIVATSITSDSKSISGMAKTEEYTIEKCTCNSYVYGEDPEFVRLFQRKATKKKAKNMKSATSWHNLFFGEEILI